MNNKVENLSVKKSWTYGYTILVSLSGGAILWMIVDSLEFPWGTPLPAPPVVPGRDWESPSLGTMKYIPAGTFTMGSPASESGRDDDEIQHQVMLTRGFWLMEHEVTQGEWLAVMRSLPPRFNNYVPNGAADKMSWDEAQEFIQKVSTRDGVHYRFPSEAEWEYAARGGESYIYAGSNEFERVGWHYFEGQTNIVCSKQRNGYGLCDMSGNVMEWVQDWYADYPGDTVDYVNDNPSSDRVLRGGSRFSIEAPRVADRNSSQPASRRAEWGFRLARSLP